MITNREELKAGELREAALDIIDAGYEAIDIRRQVEEKIKVLDGKLSVMDKEYDLSEYNRVFMVAFGKGAAMFAAAVEKKIRPRLERGIALDVELPDFKELQKMPENITFIKGTHPLPSAKNIEASEKIARLAGNLSRGDLLLVLITGGGSSLLCASKEEMEEGMMITKTLTKRGAPIEELNVVRKHLGGLKGGRLTKLAYPAKVVGLIACDVCCRPDIDLSMVASGPTTLDRSTLNEAKNILMKYGFNPYDFSLTETPKEEMYFEQTENNLFACNQDALMGMLAAARKMGWSGKIISSSVGGEANRVFEKLIEMVEPGEVLLAGGETIVKVKGRGKGGRNQEAVLSAIKKIEETQDFDRDSWVVASIASDGRDNTEAAGAVGDDEIIRKARQEDLSFKKYLEDNDSFNFFKKTGGLVRAETDSFNIADLMLIMRK